MSDPNHQPWVVYRLLPNFRQVLLERFNHRSQAEEYLRVMQQMYPNAEFTLLFDPRQVPNTAAPQQSIRHALTGSPLAVHRTIHRLHNLGYVEAGHWSPPQPTGQLDQVISLLIQRLQLE
jgi:hypothetical protein